MLQRPVLQERDLPMKKIISSSDAFALTLYGVIDLFPHKKEIAHS